MGALLQWQRPQGPNKIEKRVDKVSMVGAAPTSEMAAAGVEDAGALAMVSSNGFERDIKVVGSGRECQSLGVFCNVARASSLYRI